MNMVHYCHEIHFNTLFRNMLRQVCELRFNGNGTSKWTRNRE